MYPYGLSGGSPNRKSCHAFHTATPRSHSRRPGMRRHGRLLEPRRCSLSLSLPTRSELGGTVHRRRSNHRRRIWRVLNLNADSRGYDLRRVHGFLQRLCPPRPKLRRLVTRVTPWAKHQVGETMVPAHNAEMATATRRWTTKRERVTRKGGGKPIRRG